MCCRFPHAAARGSPVRRNAVNHETAGSRRDRSRRGRRSDGHVLHQRQTQPRLPGAFDPPLNLATRCPSEPTLRPTCDQATGLPSGLDGRFSTASDPQYSHRPLAASSTARTSPPVIFTDPQPNWPLRAQGPAGPGAPSLAGPQPRQERARQRTSVPPPVSVPHAEAASHYPCSTVPLDSPSPAPAPTRDQGRNRRVTHRPRILDGSALVLFIAGFNLFSDQQRPSL